MASDDEESVNDAESELPTAATRSQLQQPGRTDLGKDVNENGHTYSARKTIRNEKFTEKNTDEERDEDDPLEGPSARSGVNDHRTEDDEGDYGTTTEANEIRMERYGNYLERYGPHLERYGNQLERFGNQLERIGPQLERCGSNLERYGPQLEAIGRQLDRSSTTQAEGNLSGRSPHIHTQTESGNEGYTPQSADSCQGSSSQHSGRQGQWMSSPNPRRLSRRPSFQVNDGLIRHWIRRRNVDNRDLLPFRVRDDRRRTVWRNDGESRDFRRARVSSWRGHEHFRRQDNSQHNPEENNLERSGVHQNHDNGNHQNLRLRRNEEIHQDDPNYGFVLIDHQNSPGPSNRLDTPSSEHSAIRRPRSNMSLRPLNFLSPQFLGPILEYNADSDDENNDPRANVFGRRSVTGREENTIRSWVTMNNYFQPRPLFIGQGDSKAMDGTFTLQRIPFDEPLHNGPDHIDFALSRIARPFFSRNHRSERRQRNTIRSQAMALT